MNGQIINAQDLREWLNENEREYAARHGSGNSLSFRVLGSSIFRIYQNRELVLETTNIIEAVDFYNDLVGFFQNIKNQIK